MKSQEFIETNFQQSQNMKIDKNTNLFYQNQTYKQLNELPTLKHENFQYNRYL